MPHLFLPFFLASWDLDTSDFCFGFVCLFIINILSSPFHYVIAKLRRLNYDLTQIKRKNTAVKAAMKQAPLRLSSACFSHSSQLAGCGRPIPSPCPHYWPGSEWQKLFPALATSLLESRNRSFGLSPLELQSNRGVETLWCNIHPGWTWSNDLQVKGSVYPITISLSHPDPLFPTFIKRPED